MYGEVTEDMSTKYENGHDDDVAQSEFEVLEAFHSALEKVQGEIVDFPHEFLCKEQLKVWGPTVALVGQDLFT